MIIDDTILKLENIEAAYYKKKIIDGVSLEVRRGEIVSLIGPNGAGKSTAIKVIFGLLRPQSGKVIYEGKDITNRLPSLNVRNGIGYLIQGTSVFTNLSVIENLTLSASQVDSSNMVSKIGEVFDLFPELMKHSNKRAGLLSIGEQKILSLGMLLIRKPKLLLLDEPSVGLAPILANRLIAKIKEISSGQGVSILLVEHNIPYVLSVSNYVYLLRQGKIVFFDTPKQIIEEKLLEDEYFK
jgi:branched-chain amino acid transport system ATP-binding protein